MVADGKDKEQFVWNGVLDATQYSDAVVAARHRLADAAKAGDWPTVFRLLDQPDGMVRVNDWRPGGDRLVHPAAPGRMAWRTHKRGFRADRQGRPAIPDRFAWPHRPGHPNGAELG